jgi:hypothetical protein
MAAAVTGMLAWVIAVALIPPEAKLDKGDQYLAQVLRAHTGQGYAAALLAVLGAVLLAAFWWCRQAGLDGTCNDRLLAARSNRKSCRSASILAAAKISSRRCSQQTGRSGASLTR